jgi:RimJ/RimL family protein N-acetyltransferase
VSTTILKTDRLLLREATEADAAFVLELLNSPGFLENIGDRGVRTLQQATAYVRDKMIAGYRELGFGMWLALQHDGRPVGMAGLVRREGLEMPDVGYAFIPDAWGRGYAQEAAAAVMAHARDVLRFERLAAITTPENFASMAVLRKIGFTLQGVIVLPGAERESTYFTWP